MRNLLVAPVALNQIPGAYRSNRQNILDGLRQAANLDVEVVLFPELCITGYGCEDRFFSSGLLKRASASLRLIEQDPSAKERVVFVGLPIRFRNSIWNCTAEIVNGEVVGFRPKQHLAGDGIHYEGRQMKAWPEGLVLEYEYDGRKVPFGDFALEVDGVIFGIEECEDMFVPKRPGIRLAEIGVNIIVNPSASHFSVGKAKTRETIVCEGSRAFGCVYLYANLLGNEAGRAVYDGHCFVAQDGRLVARSDRFSHNLFEVTPAVVNIESSEVARTQMASFRADLTGDAIKIVKYQGSFRFKGAGSAIQPKVELAAWERSPDLEKEEWARAGCLAHFDYLWKSRANGWVVSLSGGCDSSVVSAICAFTVHMAIRALGLDGFKKRLSYLKEIQELDDPKEIIKVMLDCIYQTAKFSTEKTQTSARELATDLGANFHVVDIQPLVDAYRGLIEVTLGRKLDPKTDRLPLQNLQARVRATTPWGIANAKGKLLLTTSNRTEAILGYCTMDGDTAGGLNPIGGTGKPFLLEWVHFMLTKGLELFHKIEGFAIVDTLAPSAELEEGQTDEKDLGPYPVVERMGRLVVVQALEPMEVYDILRKEFPRYSKDDLHRWITKFFKLLAYNQWKRERLAVSFHLDDHNLDPRSWFRFPILNSGFVEELEDLDTYVAQAA